MPQRGTPTDDIRQGFQCLGSAQPKLAQGLLYLWAMHTQTSQGGEAHFETPAPDRADRPEDARSPRSEKREQVVRSLEYSRYPRRDRRQRRLPALTRDESASGLGIVMHQPEPEGALLQIGLQTLDGEIEREALALVIWCRPREDGRYTAGLSLIQGCDSRAQPRVIRPETSRSLVRLSA